MPDHDAPVAPAAPRTLVVIIDGTLSSLEEGCETHAGLLFRVLTENGRSASQRVFYHPGVQGSGWRRWWNAITGEGLNDAIRDAYAWVASRYRPGNRIFLFGYSRGAYAARSLAGFIDRVGLVNPRHATERRIRRAFRYYEAPRISPEAERFRQCFCHASTPIEMIGVWDSVKALGPPYPVLSRLGPAAVRFHDASLGPSVKAGYHALALDENRAAFEPDLWERCPGWSGALEQVWFPGAHGDVGGERSCQIASLPLNYIPFVWMLEKAEGAGLALPALWRERFPLDPSAPMVGVNQGIGRLFLLRRRRKVGAADGERMHESVEQRMLSVAGYAPGALRRFKPTKAGEPLLTRRAAETTSERGGL